MTTLPCISLHQPYASALVLAFSDGQRLKVHETRHWPVSRRFIGQRVAIHAAKRRIPAYELDRVMINLLQQALGEGWRVKLPYGAIIGTAILTACYKMDEGAERYIGKCAGIPFSVSDKLFGHWSAGRYAWRMDDPQALAEPVPQRGQQGWFSVELPA